MTMTTSTAVESGAIPEPGTGSLPGLDVRPISGYIGTEIHGVDLRTPLDAATVAAIRATLLEWKVVFFRDQDLTRDQHLAFGRQFGDVERGHPTLPSVFPSIRRSCYSTIRTPVRR